MAIRYFPIRLPSGKALEADQSNLTVKEYQVGRACQLWFTVNDTIRSKRHPKKAITVEDGWNDRGWGKQRDLTRPPQQMVKFWYNFGVFDLKRFFFIKCRFILQKFWQFLSKNDTKILPKTFW